jgi:pyruvate carboxylase
MRLTAALLSISSIGSNAFIPTLPGRTRLTATRTYDNPVSDYTPAITGADDKLLTEAQELLDVIPANVAAAIEPSIPDSSSLAHLCPFTKVMAANRGEIAIRIDRAATELNLRTASIYAYEDRNSAHRWDTDESFLLPASGSTPVGAYLNIENIVRIAKENGVDAIHPGYGFLSESAEFAQACADAGITFVGPSVENLITFGDKTKARELAIKSGVSVVPGTTKPLTTTEEAEAFVEQYGLPVMIKAAKGGGGKGMRVVEKKEDLVPLFKAASSEALASFGDGGCFVERYVKNAKHVEVQVIGDGKGNVVHLWERDCSVQRRHQKIVEIAPACHHPMEVRKAVLEDALKLTKACNYKNAGTVEFLIDDQGRHYFMEVNPRVQVEHTVTEQVTGVDIVQSTFLIAGGASLDDIGLKQENIVPRGVAMQCRITTEDPARDFAPDTGMLDVCRHSVGPGIRIDGYSYPGMVVQPYFDSLLVKYTAQHKTWDGAIRRMRRALRENHIRGVKTNIPFLLNVLDHPDFIKGSFNLNFIEDNPDLLKHLPGTLSSQELETQGTLGQKYDNIEGYLKYIANLAVNGHPKSLGADPALVRTIANYDVPAPKSSDIVDILEKKRAVNGDTLSAPHFRNILRKQGAKALAKAVRDHKNVLVTDTTWRDAHQSLLATRMRTADLLKAAEATNTAFNGVSDVFSLEMWGGATFDVSYNFLKECPWKRLEDLREAAPDMLFQMLLRGANGVGYTVYPDNVVYEFCKQAYESGNDIFRVFDSLNYIENMELGIKAAAASGGFVEAAICYTGDVTSTDPNNKYSLEYYIDYAEKLVGLGAHALCVKDMAGLLTPRAATLLVSKLRAAFPDVPIHLHTHDTSGMGVASMFAGAEAGADIVDGAIDSMSGLSSQPCLGAIVSALGDKCNLDLDALQVLNDYWESVRHQYNPFEVQALNAAIGSNVFKHEIPGGQYTNLLFQSKQLGLSGRFAEVKKAYALANKLLGDIPKVTPSSKVVGDLAQFIVGMKISEEELIANAATLPIPGSVVEYFQGALGPPPGGFPEPFRTNVLKGRPLEDGRPCFEGRPGAELPDYDFKEAEKNLKEAYGDARIGFKEVLSHAMYPKVFKEFIAHEKQYGSIDKLPTHLFLRPMAVGEESQLHLGKGKDYYIRLASIDSLDEDLGTRTVTLEVNGEKWFIRTPDTVTQVVDATSGGGALKRREKKDPTSKGSIGTPMPGQIVAVNVQEGDEVEEGQTLFKLSAMKMETEIKASISGKVTRVLVAQNDSVEGDDLLAEIV